MKGVLVLMLVCIYVMYSIDESEARGRGGFRGSFRSYRSGYRYRISGYRSRMTRSFRLQTRSWSRTMKKAAIIGGTIYIARKMRMRLGIRSQYANFEICRNTYNPLYRRYNGTRETSRRNLFGFFVCPTDDYPMHYTYCCGPQGREYCCGYWSSPGRIAGLVIGPLISLAFLGCCVYFCCCRGRKARNPPAHVEYKAAAAQEPYPPAPAYPVRR